MAIDLRNIKKVGTKNISTTLTTNSTASNFSFSQSTSLNDSTIANNLNNKGSNNLVHNMTTNNKFNIILILYNIVFIFILSSIFFVDWASVWQLPKVIAFIFGTTGFLFLSSISWIFGMIKHEVKITFGDILLVVLGISILVISFLNPNQIAFWGSAPRIFDAGIFIGFLTLYYILLKLFLDSRSFNIVFLGFAIISFIGVLVSSIVIYIPNLINIIPILQQLKPTGTWITESPQELVFISLLCFNLIFIFYFKVKTKNIISKLLMLLYYVSIFVHIMILIRLPDYNMYFLTILALVINSLIYVNKLFKNKDDIPNYKLVTSRVSFVYGIIIILVVTFAIVKPFRNNSQLPEYVPLTVPNLKTTLAVVEGSFRSDTWFGSGNVMYAWNKFAPSVNETQISDFSFETLYNEISNLLVRNGIIFAIFAMFLVLWILGSCLRMLLIYKKIPAELYILSLVIIGLFIIPFTMVTKVFLILALALWSNVFTNYFKPAFSFQLDIHKIPAPVSSLFTFIILFSIATSVFVSTKFYNIIKSQEYIVTASQKQDNPSEQINLLAQAQAKSPYIIEYAHVYIPALIQEINRQAVELSNSTSQSETGKVDSDKQKVLQDKITSTQDLINNYKKKFPSETRVIYWQLDLYSVISKYGAVDESEYLSLISKGRELQKNSLYWSLYEAQYYALEAQKEQPINLEKLDKSKSILKDTISKNPYFVQAYQNYYDILLLNQDYKEQIQILNKYVEVVVSKDRVANQDLVYLLGLAYQNNKQYEDAIAIYSRLIESLPEYTNVYFRLGEVYEAQNKKDLALQNYQKVLELDPNAGAAKIKVERLR